MSARLRTWLLMAYCIGVTVALLMCLDYDPITADGGAALAVFGLVDLALGVRNIARRRLARRREVSS